MDATSLLREAAIAASAAGVAFSLEQRKSPLAASLDRLVHAATKRALPMIVATMLLPVGIRLAILPWLPPPQPAVHDEYGHLLVADTLMAGRLANPPHPLSDHFETIYVLQQPTYASIYPIGQGAILALGTILFGHPWAGVLLSVSLMCGAVTWMLYGCLPSRWAAIGGVIGAIQFGLDPTWSYSYWGGAFGAFGGALMFGALDRFRRRRPSKGTAALAGAGWSTVALIRPFESLLLFVVAWAVVLVAIRRRRRWQEWIGAVVLLAFLQMAAGVMAVFHNRAVTGSFTTLPYQLSTKTYGVPQTFLWQPPAPSPRLRVSEQARMYAWQRQQKDEVTSRPIHHLVNVAVDAGRFFVTVWFAVPVAVFLASRKDVDAVVACALLACAIAFSSLYPFFLSHYVAAYTSVFIFVIARGLMSVGTWRVGNRQIGHAVVMFLVVGGLLKGTRSIPFTHSPGQEAATGASARQQVITQLARRGGQHVVFVRYAEDRDFHEEWVYNRASIDDSSIVWCRKISTDADREVVRYYPRRESWLADVGQDGVRLSPYDPVHEDQGSSALPVMLPSNR
jgi:hypothetical protein